MEFFVNRKIQPPTARIVPATIAIAPAATINRASHNPVHPEVLQQPISTQIGMFQKRTACTPKPSKISSTYQQPAI
jgi:hypothetical protein